MVKKTDSRVFEEFEGYEDRLGDGKSAGAAVLHQNGDLGKVGSWQLRRGMCGMNVSMKDTGIYAMGEANTDEGAFLLIQHGVVVSAEKIGTDGAHRAWGEPLPRRHIQKQHLANFSIMPVMSAAVVTSTVTLSWTLPDPYISDVDVFRDGDLVMRVAAPAVSITDIPGTGTYQYWGRYVMMNGAVGPIGDAVEVDVVE
jgi:hypothetical protein